MNLRRIDFGDRSHGWVAGSDGVIIQTSDSGDTWQMATTPTDFDLTEIVSVDDQRVWVSGNHGVILHSDNGGATWTLQNTGTSSDLRSIHFVPVYGRPTKVGPRERRPQKTSLPS